MSIRKRLTIALQALLLALLAIGGLPSFHPVQTRARDAVDPVLDVTGLWQCQWELFAPTPDRRNLRVAAVVEFDDGARAEWRSPDWPDMSAGARMRHFRLSEFVDNLPQSDNSGAWPAFARWVSRRVTHPEGRTASRVRVSLWMHWIDIPDVVEPVTPRAHRLVLDRKWRFHVEELGR